MIRALLHQPHGEFSTDVAPADIKDVLRNEHAVLWLNVQEPSQAEVALLQREFGFHELALEDALHPHQRPKLDEYDHFYFLVFYSMSLPEQGDLKLGELDLFVGANYLVAVHSDTQPEIDDALRRWEQYHPYVGHGVGGLLHSLLDTLVDEYFDTADQIAERSAVLEERIFKTPDSDTVQSIFDLKKQLLSLRRILGPERDALNALMRQDLPLLDRKTVLYLRDVYDHLVRITDTIDLHSDLLTSALDAYLSTVSNRLNQVVKTLTSVTIILMTLALIAGIYGMNFRNMPELEWQFGYGWALGLMAGITGGLVVYFKRRGWL